MQIKQRLEAYSLYEYIKDITNEFIETVIEKFLNRNIQ